MGYTHYWRQFRPFTAVEWATILAESKRIIAKATRGGYYSGAENELSQFQAEYDAQGFRVGFKEVTAWRTFGNEEIAPPSGQALKLADGFGEGSPELTDERIWLNGSKEANEDYGTFGLDRVPEAAEYEKADVAAGKGIFNCCKTEYRPYDPVVVSILHVARTIAPDTIKVTSDGRDKAIRYMF